MAFLQEVWEQSSNLDHIHEIEQMLDIEGLQYISQPRKANAKGTSYGGVAIVVNTEKYKALMYQLMLKLFGAL